MPRSAASLLAAATAAVTVLMLDTLDLLTLDPPPFVPRPHSQYADPAPSNHPQGSSNGSRRYIMDIPPQGHEEGDSDPPLIPLFRPLHLISYILYLISYILYLISNI